MAAAMAVLREQRDQIEGATRDLLVAPSMPPDEFERRLRSLYDEEIPEIWRLKTETQFLLVSLRGIFTMSLALRALHDGDVRSRLAAAIHDFEESVPDPMLLRNIHEHFDAYARGGGLQRHLLPDPASPGAIGMTQDGPIYFIGGRLFVLADMVSAGERLASAVAQTFRH